MIGQYFFIKNSVGNTVLKLIALTLLIEVILSLKLWIPINREFPLISAFRWLDFSLGDVGDSLLLIIIVLALLNLIFSKKYRRSSIVAILLFFSLLILEDINRLQPWLYMQIALLLATGFRKERSDSSTISGILLVIALVYLWGGIQKMNLGFITETFPWFLAPLGISFQFNPDQSLGGYHFLIATIPLFEFLLGVFLLIQKTRKLGVILGIIMHLFILLSLGPLGHNWNTVIWPWNLVMIIILVLLFLQKRDISILREIRDSRVHYLILVFFGLMPTLNFIGYWDNYLSSSLYSGTDSDVIYYYEGQNEFERNTYKKYQVSYGDTTETPQEKIWLIHWSILDINVPYYQADRYYKRMGEKICKKATSPLTAGIKIIKKSKFTAKKEVIKCSCLSLLKS